MAAAAPYIVAAIGTAMTIKSNNDANDERRGIMNAQLDRNTAAANKSSQLVTNEAAKYDPTQRQAAIDTQAAQVYGQEQKDLAAGAGGGTVGNVSTSGDAGNVSDDFIRSKADRALTEGNRLTDIARELSKVRAPNDVRTDEGYSNADLAGNLQSLFSTNRNQANAAMGAAGAVTPGNGAAYGQLLTGLGSSLAAGSGFTQTGSLSGGVNFGGR